MKIAIAVCMGCASAFRLNYAAGMNGDEDLGDNTLIKGDKFHY